jgi:predicted nucleic acid-binding protein
MKVVVDTNVLISGVFFGGMPSRVLGAWRDGKIDLLEVSGYQGVKVVTPREFLESVL